MTPFVSIVSPSFNQAKFLEATIESVLGQDYPNFEYIIIDGGSTDGSVEIIQRYADQLAAWISKPDQGQTDAINKGFDLAQGEILAWINSDDTYEPGAIRAAAETLHANPDIGMVYSDANYIDETGRVIGEFNAQQTDYNRLLRGAVYIPQQAAFFRSALWKKVGPLDPAFYFAMDYDLWVRLSKISSLRYIPGRPWANFRLHGAAKSIAEDDRCWPEMLQVHRREGGHPFSWMTLRYLVRSLLAPVIRRRRQRMFSNTS